MIIAFRSFNSFLFSEKSIYNRADQVNKILNKENSIHAYPIFNDSGDFKIEVENVGFLPIKVDSILIRINNGLQTLYFNKIIFTLFHNVMNALYLFLNNYLLYIICMLYICMCFPKSI